MLRTILLTLSLLLSYKTNSSELKGNAWERILLPVQSMSNFCLAFGDTEAKVSLLYYENNSYGEMTFTHAKTCQEHLEINKEHLNKQRLSNQELTAIRESYCNIFNDMESWGSSEPLTITKETNNPTQGVRVQVSYSLTTNPCT